MPHEVLRTRVLQLLERRWEHMVTTVTAGPGFGKSIAVGQAVRANQALPRGVEVWLSCRSGIEDPLRLVHAVRTAFGTGGQVRGPPLEQLAAAPGSVELLDQLLRDLPWNFHVVLCGRRLPPVALARLLAADQVVQVVDDDLRFDDAEIEGLAASAGGTVPSRDLGGWPALVRLAVAAPSGAVSDFLWDEVIRALGPADGAGSVAFHHGLTIHTAGANTTSDVRRAHSVIFFADGSTRGEFRPRIPASTAPGSRWAP